MPVKRTITRKSAPSAEVVERAPVAGDSKSPEPFVADKPRVKKCFFCTNEKEPTYTDSVTLRKFMSDRCRIQPKSRTNACSKHQRRITAQIKYARHLAILPFVPTV